MLLLLENDGAPERDVRDLVDVLLFVVLPINPPSVIRVLPLIAEELLLLLLLFTEEDEVVSPLIVEGREIDVLLLVIGVVGEVDGVAEDDRAEMDELLLLPTGEEDEVVPPLVVEGIEMEGLLLVIGDVGEALISDEEQHRS